MINKRKVNDWTWLKCAVPTSSSKIRTWQINGRGRYTLSLPRIYRDTSRNRFSGRGAHHYAGRVLIRMWLFVIPDLMRYGFTVRVVNTATTWSDCAHSGPWSYTLRYIWINRGPSQRRISRDDTNAVNNVVVRLIITRCNLTILLWLS